MANPGLVPATTLLGFSSEKGVAVNLECAGVVLAAGTAERITCWADLNRRKADVLKHLPPACTRQASGDSSGPEVDVLHCRFRNRFAVGDIGIL